MQVTLGPTGLTSTLPAHGPSGTTPSRSCACRNRGGAAVALIASCVALRPPGGSPSTPQGAARAAVGYESTPTDLAPWSFIPHATLGWVAPLPPDMGGTGI